MQNNHFQRSFRAVWLFALTAIAGCEQEEPEWPEEQIDGRSFPKESLVDAEDVPSIVCGDNVLEFGEQCEPGTWEPEPCESPGYSGGLVQCSSECRRSFAECEGGECRNGILEAGEECDTALGGIRVDCLPGQECPACTIDCQIVEAPSCGNGVLELPAEECDGDLFLDIIQYGAGRVDLSRYDSSTLICNADCGVILTSAQPAECGNGIEEAGENCETGGGRTLHRESGGLRERCIDCVWQPDDSRCGDGIVQSDFEDCDGESFVDDRSTCVDWENIPGRPDRHDMPVACYSSCEIDSRVCFGFDPDADADADAGGEADDDARSDILEDTVGDDVHVTADSGGGAMTDTAGNADFGLAPDAGSPAEPAEDENGCTVSARRSVGANTLWSIAALLGLAFVSRRPTRSSSSNRPLTGRQLLSFMRRSRFV